MISIVIPVYNEEDSIPRLLGSLPDSRQTEVIVVDGGSRDRTVELAAGYPVRIIRHVKNRAMQMNRGAEASAGDILLFLHADCRPEPGALEAIEDLVREGYGGGCLSQRIDSERRIFRFIEAPGNFRARRLNIFYGDQALFVRRDVFFAIGGFDEVDLFEDVMFCARLKKAASVVLSDRKVRVSPRRWLKQGVIKTTLINWLLTLGFLAGVSPARLRKIYLDIR